MHKKRIISFFSLCGFLPGLLGSTNSWADIYKYQDPAGQILLTDRPQSGKYTLLKVFRFGYPTPPKKQEAVTPERLNLVSATPAPASAGRQRYSPIIDAVAKREKLDPALVHAVVRAESGYNPQAVSPAGAVGLMQLMPGTAKRYGVDDSRDPVANVGGGARYLRDLLEMFDNRLELALAAYNAGEQTVIDYGWTIPPYPETQTYVRRVLAYYREHR